MKDLTQFRKDLAAWMEASSTSQVSLSRSSGVDQAILSRFLREKDPEGLSGKSVLLLYPFVYGNQRAPAKVTPPDSPAEVRP